MQKVLIANRGEIAIRIAHSISEAGYEAIGLYSKDDVASLHLKKMDGLLALSGEGAKAYLDSDEIVRLAKDEGIDAIHPGYGFLSENADFAEAVEKAGMVFVGPSPKTLKLFGDKVAARNLAIDQGIPVLKGSGEAVSLEEATAFFDQLASGHGLMLKALAGGGGRGMRIVIEKERLASHFERASSEATAAFGNGDLFVEEYLPKARHIEVQILGDGEGGITHFYERECSAQRRHQKIIEIAPAPNLDAGLRDAMIKAAIKLGKATNYRGLGTIEFLVDEETNSFYFMEANARLQVEHTVTEEVLGLDLVAAQLGVVSGKSLSDLGLTQEAISSPKGYAIQMRINMEDMKADGTVLPSAGTLTAYEPPLGRGIRLDGYGYNGYQTNLRFDSLLAKLIIHSEADDFALAAKKAYRALCEFRIEGVKTNLGFLQNLTSHEAFKNYALTTTFIDDNVSALVNDSAHATLHTGASTAEATLKNSGLAGAQLKTSDPLAVLDHGKGASVAIDVAPQMASAVTIPEGFEGVNAPMQGLIVSYQVGLGDEVPIGKTIAIMEAMKMEHEIRSEVSGIVQSLGANIGDTVIENHPLVILEPQDIAAGDASEAKTQDLDHIRPDLQEVFDRKAAGYDENRPEAVAKRYKTGRRTARENIEHLCDAGSFVEYGSVVVAAQRRRRDMQDLIKNTTGDGMVCGLGSVNGDFFDEDKARVMAMTYDYMVLAGTQGKMNHYKKDRMFEIAKEQQLPTILFAEGGGGRPGDTDATGVAGLDCLAFSLFAELSGLVPVVGITTGRCFAGNAVLLGCCDVIIATEGSNIGIGGPAMIEGGGLGVFTPDEVGPMDVQVPNGVVDIAVKDEAEAVEAAKKYLSYFQGSVEDWRAPDERELRFIVPENRLRYYDIRKVIEGIADIGSILELRKEWGIGIITSFARVEGRPVGIIANNPVHLSGAIDSDAADKATRFIQLCDAFDIPLVSLIDCPGIMVGPEVEKTALVRHAARMMVTAANIEVPLMAFVIRKGYGLGAQAMAGGGFRAPLFTLTWPTGEFGGMGLEGAVKLGYRKELQAIEDPEERKALYEKMVAQSYERGKAVNMASHFELDDVIDPANTRKWIMAGLKALPPKPVRTGKRRPNVDTW